MMRVAATAIEPDGRFVFHTHHYDARSRLRRVPRAGHYREGGIFRYLFDRAEIVAETRPYFDAVSCRPIQIALPLAGRLRLPLLRLSRAAERIPLVNQLGALLLVIARRPRPVPQPPGRRSALSI
jgi:hypothetical protein